MLKRIPDVIEAEEIVIELDDVYWTTTPSKRRYIEESVTRKAWASLSRRETDEEREKKLQDAKRAILASLARRLKYEFLLWRIYGRGDSDQAPREIFRGFEAYAAIPFKVVEIKPCDEAQVTPGTKVIVTLAP